VQPAKELAVDRVEEAPSADEQQERDNVLMAIDALAQIENVEQDEKLHEQLEFVYPYSDAVTIGAKASITEMKRIREAFEEEEESFFFGSAPGSEETGLQEDVSFTLHLQRPAFMEQRGITATERGSINHLIMQHLPLDGIIDREVILATIQHMVAVKLITPEQATVINVKGILELFQSQLGERMGTAVWIKRELPFAFMLPACDVYREVTSHTAEEPIFIQGVIDCLFEDSQGLVLVDYKTDTIYQGNWAEKAEHHRFQLEMYARGLEMILQRKIDEIYVFFFDGGVSVRL